MIYHNCSNKVPSSCQIGPCGWGSWFNKMRKSFLRPFITGQFEFIADFFLVFPIRILCRPFLLFFLLVIPLFADFSCYSCPIFVLTI